ncbi:PREDICTED: uncharacterized protein LOC107087572 [Cyprinodon variegatus]|uniref:uncharacterized protein LOC107087572 n=1 Tax=Cyprinodon variegatus TaxID=28743 RepID=UPI000742AEAE|nr:PREDICTED: uncharacterized protein LOC107087572 [Cyprinodon variegatus]
MFRRLFALFLLTTTYLTQANEVPHQVPLKVVEVGENVTLHCPVSTKEGKFFYWYKQTPGYMLQTVAAAALSDPKLSEQFDNSRFSLTKGDSQFSLTIRNISKKDEATYLCQNGTAYFQTFSTGMYLAVNDCKRKTQILVKQTPESTSVQEGDTVNLHCSLLTKTSVNSLQCPSKYNVYWFKAGSGESYPSLIYTPKNSSDVQQRSCVYKLSKTIQSSSDTGIHYCAVITCGKILFGEGTNVQTREPTDLLIIGLSVMLGLCVILIAVLLFVYWFKAGSGESYPSLIYTPKNSSDVQQRSCVYKLSKTIQNSSDTGIYYCAVITCEKILFGEGTKVQKKSQVGPVVLALAVLLTCCVTAIVALIVYINCTVFVNFKGKNKGRSGQKESSVNQTRDPGEDADEASYVALNFSAIKTKGKKRRMETQPECLYSAVRTGQPTRQGVS